MEEGPQASTSSILVPSGASASPTTPGDAVSLRGLTIEGRARGCRSLPGGLTIAVVVLTIAVVVEAEFPAPTGLQPLLSTLIETALTGRVLINQGRLAVSRGPDISNIRLGLSGRHPCIGILLKALAAFARGLRHSLDSMLG
jgi:hypothetical protein